MSAAATMQEPVPASVPDAVRPPPGSPRFPLIDGVRAIAVLSVFVFHLVGVGETGTPWWLPVARRLDVGVAIFFVVSGFLLYRPFVAARVSGAPAPRWTRYARRRVLRIVPAYWLALTVLAIYPGLNGFGAHWWTFYSFLQIYHIDWFVFDQGLVQAWSLCVEVSFYVALPLLAALLARLSATDERRRARRELAILAALAVAAVAFRFYIASLGPGRAGTQTLPAMFCWFALGMALAVVSATAHLGGAGQRVPAWVARHPGACWLAACGGVALGAVIGGDGAGVTSTTTNTGEHVLYGVIAVLVIAPAVFPAPAGAPRRVLAHPAVAWLGLISYGIFLWHLTVLNQLAEWHVGTGLAGVGFLPLGVVGLVASVAVAAASYYLLERPLLRFKEPRRNRVAAVAPAPR